MHYTAQISKPAYQSKVTILKSLCLQKGSFHDKIDSTFLGLNTFGVWHHAFWWAGTTSIETCAATMWYQKEGGSRFLQNKLCDTTP
jgi:hypothetical protein